MCRRIAAIKFNEIRADLVGSHHTVISHRTLRNQITNTELFDHVRKLGVSRGCWRRVSIAANYLMQTGQIPIGLDIYQPLLDSIVEDYRAGQKNKLRLANRAIARFEKLTWNLSDEVA